MVTPFMLLAEAVYTIVDKNKILMGFLGAIVSSEILIFSLQTYYQLFNVGLAWGRGRGH